ncbi:unnamed protein product, partial [Rotaria magnacalcarata]
TSQPLQKELGGDVLIAQNDDLTNKIEDLKNEIEELQRKLLMSHDRYHDEVKSNPNATSTIREF